MPYDETRPRFAALLTVLVADRLWTLRDPLLQADFGPLSEAEKKGFVRDRLPVAIRRVRDDGRVEIVKAPFGRPVWDGPALFVEVESLVPEYGWRAELSERTGS